VFTIKELKLMARLIENTPLQGTMLTLPATLQEILIVRQKLQTTIDEAERPKEAQSEQGQLKSIQKDDTIKEGDK
jgi:hypothetical protein